MVKNMAEINVIPNYVVEVIVYRYNYYDGVIKVSFKEYECTLQRVHLKSAGYN